MDMQELVLFQLNVAKLAATFLLWQEEEQQKKKKQRKFWVNPYLRESYKGRFGKDFQNMIQNPDVFNENFHISLTCFGKLHGILEAHLVPKRKSRPDCIPPQSKLALFLEYLASGDIQRHVCSSYRFSKSRMGVLIDSVCDAICAELKIEIAPWNVKAMQQYADEFEDAWHFPNCIGAIDGKHVAIKALLNSGSLFYNYKGFHSIVLLAECNASYMFNYADVGAYGSEGDANVFSSTKFGQHVLSDTLDFPNDKVVGGTKLPYFLIGDDAFPLCKRIMKPYSGKNVAQNERIFNYRLNRARR